MKADYHVHSQFSDDCSYPMEEVVLEAIEKGLDEICFTEHVDYGIKVDWDEPEKIIMRYGLYLTNADYPKYLAKIEEMKSKYQDKIRIKTGLEFGMQPHTIPQFKKLFDRYDFDFIICSCHQVNNLEFWNQEYQEGKTQDEYQFDYYHNILSVIKKYKDYAVLGHLDMLVRYDKQGDYPFEKIKPIVTEILKIVIEDGKGIEINTSSHYYGLKDLTPSRDILKLYKQLGGTIVTIGSDSHKKGQIGSYFEETLEEMRKLGFDAFYTFEKMKPIAHKI